MNNLLSRILPDSFIWRLSLLNFVLITAAIAVSGWAIYHTACFLAGGLADFTPADQERFNATLFQYLLLFAGIAVLGTTLIQVYFTKKVIRPIHELIAVTKQLKLGIYPPPLNVKTNGEMKELIDHYNGLLIQLERNESERDKLIADVSHELRTPIANITGYMVALKSGKIAGSPELFASLYEESLRLTELVEQVERLNEWTNRSDGVHSHFESASIARVIHQSVKVFALQFEQAGIPYELDVEDMNLMLHAEGLQQVMANLLANAIQYNEGEEPVRIKGRKMKKEYRLTVSNPGIMILPEDRTRLFDRFYRADPSRHRETGGNGLGLAIAKEIIERHHGTITVDVKNGYNTFIISLPFCANDQDM